MNSAPPFGDSTMRISHCPKSDSTRQPCHSFGDTSFATAQNVCHAVCHKHRASINLYFYHMNDFRFSQAKIPIFLKRFFCSLSKNKQKCRFNTAFLTIKHIIYYICDAFWIATTNFFLSIFNHHIIVCVFLK